MALRGPQPIADRRDEKIRKAIGIKECRQQQAHLRRLPGDAHVREELRIGDQHRDVDPVEIGHEQREKQDRGENDAHSAGPGHGCAFREKALLS
jgi:hypothetical protein